MLGGDQPERRQVNRSQQPSLSLTEITRTICRRIPFKPQVSGFASLVCPYTLCPAYDIFRVRAGLCGAGVDASRWSDAGFLAQPRAKRPKRAWEDRVLDSLWGNSVVRPCPPQTSSRLPAILRGLTCPQALMSHLCPVCSTLSKGSQGTPPSHTMTDYICVSNQYWQLLN